jgi:hypothetical protein
MSTTMLATTMNAAARITVPMITGRSCVVTDCTASWPSPGNPKMFSTMITPPRPVSHLRFDLLRERAT